MTELFASLDTPCVLVDLDRVEVNLKRAQAHADKEGYALRPHTKTHKLPRFARRAEELGATGITVQKLGEAEIMADSGLKDIFLPYNIVGPLKLARLKALNTRVSLSVTADSPDTVAGYAATFTPDAPLTVLIECDTGAGRCGVQGPAQVLALARQIIGAPGLRFGGLMTYPPLHNFSKSCAWLRDAVDLLGDAGIAVQRVSSGNSPDMWDANEAPVTERRPGTYIYFDRFQVQEKVASFDDCALTVLATVVSRPTSTRIVIDAGSKTLSSDLMGMSGHGLVVGTDYLVKALSEEHGVIEMPEASDWPHVGDRIRILPNHACVVSNLFDEIVLVSGDKVLERVVVASRGRVD